MEVQILGIRKFYGSSYLFAREVLVVDDLIFNTAFKKLLEDQTDSMILISMLS